MAASLIRKLSEDDLATRRPAQDSVQPPAPVAETQPVSAPAPTPELPDSAPAPISGDEVAEFRSNRAAGLGRFAPRAEKRRDWQAELSRLEETFRRALAVVTGGGVVRPSSADAPPQAPPGRPPNGQDTHPPSRETLHPGYDATPETSVYSDTQPGDDARHDAEPAAPDTQGGLDEYRHADEPADGTQAVSGDTPDYPQMEDQAIDRLLKTTNALLETDDHTRKNQSLDRMKAAVVATEAERRIRVTTASGTVTLDFDKDNAPPNPMSTLLDARQQDPKKRAKQLQRYRQMIANSKKKT